MKFKSIMLLSAVTCVTVFGTVSCAKEDIDVTGEDQKNIEFADLPVNAQALLTKSGSVAVIDGILMSSDGYDVSMGNFKIDFDKNGEWKKIKSKNSSALPESILSLVPAVITSHVKEFYSPRGILKIEKDKEKYEVKLTGKPEVEIDFDMDGNVIEDSNLSGPIEYASLPAAAKAFLSEHYANIGFTYIKKQGTHYRVRLIEGTEIEFLANGDIQLIVAPYGGKIPTAALMPAISSYLSKKYSGKTVFKYVKQGYEGYLVQLNGYPVIKLLFDTNGNFIRRVN